MIRDVTHCWESERTAGGLYIVRSTIEGLRDRVRLGAGGNHGGKRGIYLRLSNHRKPRPSQWRYETHRCRPFRVVHAWQLGGWSPRQIEGAEHCLYRAFLMRFRKHRGTLPDRSLFVVPEHVDLAGIIAEVDHDLHVIEGL
jgi:hypothetical protein